MGKSKVQDPGGMVFLGQKINMKQGAFVPLTEMQIVWLSTVLRGRDGLDTTMQTTVLAALESALQK